MVDYLRRDDITVPQGTTFAVYWPLFAADCTTPLVTTGWTARAMARKTVDNTTVLASWLTSDGSLAYSTVGTESRITMFFTPSQTSAWTWKAAHYDIELINASAAVIRLTQGFLTLDKETTR